MLVRTRLFIYLFIYLLLNRQQKKEKGKTVTNHDLFLLTCYLLQNNFANVWLKIL